jgi:hypothetical protein
MVKRTRVTIELDPELYAELKALAARRGKTVRQVCIEAFERETLDESSSEYLILRRGDPLAELWDNEADAIFDNV